MSRMCEELELYFDNEEFSDVTFRVQGKTIHAHRLVLASASEYYKKMFSLGFRESAASSSGRDDAIEILDCSYESFCDVLKYIYSGRLPNLETDFSEGYGKFGGQCGEEDFEERRMGNSQLQKACEILELADQYMLDHLKQVIERLLSNEVNPDTWSILLSHGRHCNADQLVALCEYFSRNSPESISA